ncbi:MAG: hypothetical protein ACI9CE_003187, partial [Flavobacterium sp.]
HALKFILYCTLSLPLLRRDDDAKHEISNATYQRNSPP